MKTFPKAKTENIVVQHLGAETLVYDLTTHKAYNLNETSSIIFNACDGQTSFDELKRQHKFTDDLIYLALDKLKENNLIAEYESNHFAGLSRREVIRKVGLASLVALPVISAIVAPKATMAASCIASGGSFTPAADPNCNNFPSDCLSQAARCCSGQIGGGSCSFATGATICTCQ